MQPHHRGLIEINIASLLLGVVPLFVKAIPLGSVSLIFWRSVFGALALGAFLLVRRQWQPLLGRREVMAVAAVAILVAVHWVTYFQAIKVSTVAIGMTALFTYPALTVLIEPLVFGERPRPLDVLLAVLALIGVALIVPSLRLEDGAVQGVLWGVFSAFFFALRNVCYRRYLRRISGGQMMIYQFIVVMLALVAFIEPVAGMRPSDWALLALLGGVFTGVAHSLFVTSMQSLKAKTVSLIACLQPVYGIILAAIVLLEHPNLRTAIGAAIVLTVAVLESLRGPLPSATAPARSETAPAKP
jgi:drug/metabolite transporter (DMT)-like permease